MAYSSFLPRRCVRRAVFSQTFPSAALVSGLLVGTTLALAAPAKNTARAAAPAPRGSAATPTRIAQNLPPAPAAVARSVQKMGKVIKVPELTLPSASKPLPRWMQAASIGVDRLEKELPLPAGSSNSKHPNQKSSVGAIAQSQGAAPVRNPGAPVTNSDRLSNQIEVAVSTFVVLLTTTDLQTVAVADPDIADVAVVNSRAVLLNGKTAGATSLVIVDGQKIRQYSVRVLPAIGSRTTDVETSIGLPGVEVRQIRDSLVLEGEVGSAEEARRAEEIAKIYSEKVVNQLAIRGQVSAEAGRSALLSDLIEQPGVSVRYAGDTVILTGTVETEAQRRDAETIARATTEKVLNLIKLPPLSVEAVRQTLGAQAELPTQPVGAGLLPTPLPLVVREAGGQIIIEGEVASQAEADLALRSAERTGLIPVNRLTVRPAATEDDQFAARVAKAIGRPNIFVRGTPQRLVLEGTVTDTNEAVLVEQVARAFSVTGHVDNMLLTRNPVQVSVDVNIVELNRNDARSLGVQIGSAALLSETVTPGQTSFVPDPNNPGQFVQQTTPDIVNRTIDPTFNQGTITAGNGFAGGGPFQLLDAFRVRLNALVQNGRGRVLSNPRTTVLSGRTATFQAGGQVPIPSANTISAAGSTTSITFKDYGILLDVVPNALPNGVVTMRVRTEVSQPDFANGVTPPGGGSPIPGFRRRSTITEITVPPGGTVALGGLITSEEVKSESRIPILSKIPILGALFRSKEFRDNKTELIVFVQPRVLPNSLPSGANAPSGVVAVGNNTNVATQLGNPGLGTFNTGNSIITGQNTAAPTE